MQRGRQLKRLCSRNPSAPVIRRKFKRPVGTVDGRRARCRCSGCASCRSGRETDREVRRFAIETDRILVTLGGDFGNLIRFSPSGTPGVIWLRPRSPTEANIRSILAKWLYRLREIDLHGQLVVVEEDKLRIRGAIEE